MSLDSNAVKDRMGNSLPHFTPVPSPDSAGVNLFAQDLSQHGDIISRPYVFPPSIMVGPVLKFLGSYGKSFIHVVMDTYPRKYTGGLLLRGKQLRHGNWLLWAIQTPCYCHQSMAGCPINVTSLATSGHLPYTFKYKKEAKTLVAHIAGHDRNKTA